MRTRIGPAGRAVGVALSVLLAVGVASTAAAQEQLKSRQVGAALAFPLLTNILGSATYMSITNISPEDRNLHFNVIGDDWEVTDFDCPVTASETVLAVWRIVGPGVNELSLECNQASGLDDTIVKRFSFTIGTLFVSVETHECKDGTCTTNENDLLGGWHFLSPEQGIAFAAEPIAFQGKDPLAGGVGDREYRFDNGEYTMFPGTLASNFLATGINPSVQGVVSGQLFLFTLDGRANAGPQAALDILFFDDEETPTSAHHTFDCLTVVGLEVLNPNFDAAALGSDSGHFYMYPIDTDQNTRAHDTKFGNGNGIRVVGVHGWLIQSVNNNFWARTLAQGMNPQDVDGADIPTFDGL